MRTTFVLLLPAEVCVSCWLVMPLVMLEGLRCGMLYLRGPGLSRFYVALAKAIFGGIIFTTVQYQNYSRTESPSTHARNVA